MLLFAGAIELKIIELGGPQNWTIKARSRLSIDTWTAWLLLLIIVDIICPQVG